MEMEKMGGGLDDQSSKDDEAILPGFRFHPTDEELIGFYLRRKVEKKPISIELIKQIDIYKYDPWDLPKVSSVGDKEMYFFCIRGRKYRNSIRPNRVTGSGFWKATGIDKPIYSVTGQPNGCIGLKKSLVYYRGSAGKGTKTDWMMHEFRLPPAGKATDEKNISQEAEVWTLCRIFKRNASYKKYMPSDCSTHNPIKQINPSDSSSKTCSLEESDNSSNNNNNNNNSEVCPSLSLRDKPMSHQLNSVTQPISGGGGGGDGGVQFTAGGSSPGFWSSSGSGGEEFFRDGNWDELRSVVDLAIHDPSNTYQSR